MSDVPAPQPSSDRVRVQRLPKRGVYDRAVVHAILDEGLVCHVGFVADGQPFVIPMTYARVGDVLYIHGSAASRMLRSAREGIPVAVTVTLLDGLVLARSAFHHSMNYRSVVALGIAREVAEPGRKLAALEAIVEHVVAGRTAQSRPPNAGELKGTLVLSLPLDEVSAKVRTGPPLDDEEDYGLPYWAGVIPLRLTPSPPVADPRLAAGLEPPEGVRSYRRPG